MTSTTCIAQGGHEPVCVTPDPPSGMKTPPENQEQAEALAQRVGAASGKKGGKR